MSAPSSKLNDLPIDISLYDPDTLVLGPWRRIGEEVVSHVQSAQTFKGLGSVPVQTVQVPISRRVERRHVWVYVGEEERTVEC